MKLERIFNTFNLLIVISLLILMYFAFKMLHNQRLLTKSQENRYQSMILADELRQSSDDLTNYCRAYVMIGDSSWENKYWDVLAIRNGKKRRADGRLISLLDSMKKLGFSDAEFNKLRVSEKKSNQLVWTEKIAFHAMKGLYMDADSGFSRVGKPDTSFARSVVFNKAYFENKEQIMKPIGDFFVMLKQRTDQEVQKYQYKGYFFLTVIIGLLLLIGLLSVISYFTLRNRILIKLHELNQAYCQIKDRDEELKARNEELDRQIDIVNRSNTRIMEQNCKLDETNQSKNKFFSIIAHDLRGPLGLLVNYSEILYDKSRSRGCQEVEFEVKTMHDLSKNAYNFLGNLLTWGRLQISGGTTIPVPIRFNKAVIAQIEVVSFLAAEKAIGIHTFFDEEFTIFADKDQIDFVIRNVLSNALKFTPKNGDVSIFLSYSETPGMIRFRIKDNGVGMSDEQLKSAFILSESHSTKGTEGERGTGMGLMLCRDFIEINEGYISIESELNKGTTVWFDIPQYARKQVS